LTVENTPISKPFLGYTASIVVAYLSENEVAATALRSLIRTVHKVLESLGNYREAAVSPVPAVNPKKSVFPSYLICLEDGNRYVTLTRHLKTAFGMTPREYRSKWDLPDSYPMVAPNHSKKRSHLAKSFGLGKHRAVVTNELAIFAPTSCSSYRNENAADRGKLSDTVLVCVYLFSMPSAQASGLTAIGRQLFAGAAGNLTPLRTGVRSHCY
jgi:predicted transcriptional regulator